MKTKFTINMALLVVTAVLLTSSCIHVGDGIKPSDNYITRDYKVSEFNEIDASTVGNIEFTQSTDNTTSVEAYGPDNIVDLIQIAIKDNRLILTIKKKKVNNVKGMKIKISSPNLQSLKMRGVGNTYIEKGLNTPMLTVENHGVGNVKIQGLQSENVSVLTRGVGNVEISGTAINATLITEGVGNLKAEKLICENVDVRSEGVGNASCYATKTISATSKGIGNIRYKGDPIDKKINKSGIGSIKGK